MQNSYSAVANEYYDAQLHPTCAGFGVASGALMKRHFELVPDKGTIFEIGAGRSGLLGVMPKATGARLLISDISLDMLNHSRSAFNGRAEFLVCDAGDLPVESSSVDLVVALLGDPYNSSAVWTEVCRALKNDGGVFFTTPSWEWSTAFRNSAPGERTGSAFFFTGSGNALYLPSEILPVSSQIQLMGDSGLEVQWVDPFTLGDLKSTGAKIPSKLGDYLHDATPVVTGYWATKVSL